MDLVDEENGVVLLFEFGHHRLEAFLEITPIARSGQQGAHVEREDRRAFQNVRHLLLDDTPGQSLGNRRLADARIADVERIVLGPAAENLNGPLDLMRPSDQGIDLAPLGLGVQIDAVGVQRLATLLDHLLALLFLGALDRSALFLAGHLSDSVANVVDGVQPGHLLLLQEVDRIGFALAEDGDQHVGARHFLATGVLDMDGRALQDALESGCRLCIADMRVDQIGELVIDVLREIGTHLLERNAAGAQNRDRILVLRQSH